jgi:hypothetical protein
MHSSLVLPDGRVLIAGGKKIIGTEEVDDERGGTITEAVEEGLKEVEILDSRTFEAAASPPMSTPRLHPGLYLLSDSEVAIVGGGATERSTSPDLEIVQLSEGRFLPVPPFPGAYRTLRDALALSDGGLACICHDESYKSFHLAVLSPSRGSWRLNEVRYRKHPLLTGSLVLTRDGGSLLLTDLVGTPLLVDLESGRPRFLRPFPGRLLASAFCRLPGNRILVWGHELERFNSHGYYPGRRLLTAIFDYERDSWTSCDHESLAMLGAAVTLKDGRVVLLDSSTEDGRVQVFDPGPITWLPPETPPGETADAFSASALPDDSILVTGGRRGRLATLKAIRRLSLGGNGWFWS